MTYLLYTLTGLHAAIAVLIILQSMRDGAIFSLRPVLMFSLLMYVTVPLLLCMPNSAVLINGALVPVNQWALAWAGFAGLAMAFMILLVPPPAPPTRADPADEKWISVLFGILFVINTWTLISFVRSFDMDAAMVSLVSGTSSRIRDLAYDTLVDADSGFGYVTKVLALAIFGWLWCRSDVRKSVLLAGVSPVIILDIISLGRHTVASFLVILFFSLEQSGSRRKLYIAAPLAILAIFFFRVILFSLTDTRYEQWGSSAFTASSDGVEALGEFFNTFGTYLMISAIPAARFDWQEILSMLASQGVLPPGTGGLWQRLTETEFPLFRISALMKANFGPHPAHLSIVDIYTFGVFSLIGIVGYYLTARWASQSRSAESGIVYVYLIGMFYLPFRGSLTLNAIRFIWLIIALGAIAAMGRYFFKQKPAAQWPAQPQPHT